MALTDRASDPRMGRLPGQGGGMQDFFAALRSARGGLALPVLIYLLAALLPLQASVGGLNLTGVRVVLLVMVLPLLFRLLAGHYGRVNLIDVVFLLHVGWMTVALAVNNPDQVVANAGSTSIEFLGGYLLGRAFIRSREDFLALLKFLGLAVLCLFPFAVVEALTGTSPLLNLLGQIPGLGTVRLTGASPRLGLSRVQLVFAHPIHSGLFFAVLFPLFFVGMKTVWGDTRRMMIATLAAASGFLALSSGALLAMLLQLGLIAWAWAFRWTKRRWLILLGMAVLAYVTVDLLSSRSPMRVFMTYATFSPHNAYWRSIIFDWGVANVLGDAERGITGSPIFGIGLNDWIRPSYMRSGSMDNFWLVTALRYGVPGFSLLAIGYLMGVWWVMRRDFDADPVLWQFRRAWVFAFAGLSFTLSTVHVWHTMYSLVFFFFGAGMWMLTAEPTARAQGAETPAPPADRPRPRYSRFDPAHHRPAAGTLNPGRARPDRPRSPGNAAPGRHGRDRASAPPTDSRTRPG